jgi:co-chaperonin GroES (HSP10)
MKKAFEPHKITKANFKPIGSHVIVCDMSFDVRITNGGILLPNDDMKSAGIRPRWGKIYAVGPDQKDPELVEGKWIMISHGRWTRGVDIIDEETVFNMKKGYIKQVLRENPILNISLRTIYHNETNGYEITLPMIEGDLSYLE